MLVSVIVPTYKDMRALELILESLNNQTYKNIEVVITEDEESLETKQYIESTNFDYKIQHFSHKDIGNRKAIIINKALPFVNGEYIIFIDGDVIPFSDFVESHIKLSEKKVILCGRRVNLGDKVSQEIRERIISPQEIENNYLKYYFYITNDNSRHYEQGLRFDPNSLLYGLIREMNKNVHILGSNFSCFREDIYAINGFDEDVVGCSKDDVDLEWRFLASGCTLKSCKYSANLFHLNHQRNSRIDDEAAAKVMMDINKKEGRFVCINGMKKK